LAAKVYNGLTIGSSQTVAGAFAPAVQYPRTCGPTRINRQRNNFHQENPKPCWLNRVSYLTA